MLRSLEGLGGCRVIAVFEGAKAVLILATGFGLLSLIHHDVQAVAAELIRHLHLNPASKIPKIFLALCGQLTDTRLWMLALIALADAVLRTIEAVGLWLCRAWAKWLGVISGLIYLPFEIYEISRHTTLLKIAAFIANVLIVVYLAYLIRKPEASPSAATST